MTLRTSLQLYFFLAKLEAEQVWKICTYGEIRLLVSLMVRTVKENALYRCIAIRDQKDDALRNR